MNLNKLKPVFISTTFLVSFFVSSFCTILGLPGDKVKSDSKKSEKCISKVNTKPFSKGLSKYEIRNLLTQESAFKLKKPEFSKKEKFDKSKKVGISSIGNAIPLIPKGINFKMPLAMPTQMPGKMDIQSMINYHNFINSYKYKNVIKWLEKCPKDAEYPHPYITKG